MRSARHAGAKLRMAVLRRQCAAVCLGRRRPEPVRSAVCEGWSGDLSALCVQGGAAVVAGETCPNTSASTSGLAFYTGGSYPAKFNGALFFADYSRKCVWAMLAGANGVPDPAKLEVFVQNAASPVDLQTGPGGDLF